MPQLGWGRGPGVLQARNEALVSRETEELCGFAEGAEVLGSAADMASPRGPPAMAALLQQ